MRQTLFFIPHSLGPLNTLGPISWAMVGFAIYVIATAIWLRGRSTWTTFIQENGFGWLIGVGIIGWILPMIELRIQDGTPHGIAVGLPVRGYGVMLMLGVLSAIGIAIPRLDRVNINRDSFFSLALWSILGGLFGARLFYVLQKWSELEGDTIRDKFWTAMQFTEGGLVVYGGAIGGLLVIAYWSWRHRTNPIPLMDAVIPAFFIGLCLGRIGCLMNGCCYGGVCAESLPSIRFPVGSPAYMDQLHNGRLLGIHTNTSSFGDQNTRIDSIDPGSWAETKQIQPNQVVQSIRSKPVFSESDFNPLGPPHLEARIVINDSRYLIPPSQMPETSLPVHPAQIYASISALLLCLWTLSISNWAQRPGLVLGAGLIGYGVLRILEEIIRVDEGGQFGTALSISQWISLIGIATGAVFLFQALKKNTTAAIATSTPADR